MIVKRNFSPLKVWAYIRRPLVPILVWAIMVWGAQVIVPGFDLAFPFTPVALYGSALAIFVAFRNNSAYGRWWEARQIWGNVVQSCRVMARLLITFTDSHAHQPQYDPDRSAAFKNEMVFRVLAWAHALRLHLRGEEVWEPLRSYLREDEWAELESRQNKPSYLQLLMGRAIYQAMADGTLGGFDSFQLEGQLLAMAGHQAAAERIKHTPLPRQYDYFTRVFVQGFAFLLPFGVIGFFQSAPWSGLSWLTVPLTAVLAGVFVIMERTGAANEDPFENRITDVPMTALCTTIERDLKELLGREDLPAPPRPEDGYLY